VENQGLQKRPYDRSGNPSIDPHPSPTHARRQVTTSTAVLIGVLCGLGINPLINFAVHFARERRRQRAHAARMSRCAKDPQAIGKTPEGPA
jgi:hypothetical protein